MIKFIQDLGKDVVKTVFGFTTTAILGGILTFLVLIYNRTASVPKLEKEMKAIQDSSFELYKTVNTYAYTLKVRMDRWDTKQKEKHIADSILKAHHLK
jgi:predicted AAA+ superfamily ATPase